MKTLPQPKDVINTVAPRPHTPPDVFFRSSDVVTISAPIKTPTNAVEFDEIIHKAIDGKATQQEIMKLGKAGSKAYVEKVFLETTNTELLENQQRKKEKAKRSNQQLGKGRIMNHEVLEEREVRKRTDEQKKRADKQEKEFWEVWKSVWSLIAEPQPPSPKKKTNEKAQAIRPIAIHLDPPTLAPPEPCLPNKDPERRVIQTEQRDVRDKGIRGGRGGRGRRPAKGQSEVIHKIKDVVTALPVYTAFWEDSEAS